MGHGGEPEWDGAEGALSDMPAPPDPVAPTRRRSPRLLAPLILVAVLSGGALVVRHAGSDDTKYATAEAKIAACQEHIRVAVAPATIRFGGIRFLPPNVVGDLVTGMASSDGQPVRYRCRVSDAGDTSTATPARRSDLPSQG